MRVNIQLECTECNLLCLNKPKSRKLYYHILLLYGRITEYPKGKWRCTMRVNIQLECTECKRRNYSTSKNKKNTTERLEVNKYCTWDKNDTLHKETKK